MEIFHRWEAFYTIVGTCAGALIGLQFVVMTLMADRQVRSGSTTHGALATPVTVHFCVALLLSTLLCVPWPNVTAASLALGVVGLGGMAYIGFVWRRLQQQTDYPLVAEDWLFRVTLPMVAYVVLTFSSYWMNAHLGDALFGVGAVSLMLLFNGIHDAWDSILYLLLKRSDVEPSRERAVRSNNLSR